MDTTTVPTSSADPAAGIPAGWAFDPFARHELRYWDGTAWTEHVSDRGIRHRDAEGLPAARTGTAGRSRRKARRDRGTGGQEPEEPRRVEHRGVTFTPWAAVGAVAVLLGAGVLSSVVDRSGSPSTGVTRFAGLSTQPPASTPAASVPGAAGSPGAAGPGAQSGIETSGKAGAGELTARQALARLAVQAATGTDRYPRSSFGDPTLTDAQGCQARDAVLRRDLTGLVARADGDCRVRSGRLTDPYTGRSLRFSATGTSRVELDHVVPLGDAWRTGARALTPALRRELATDPLNLLAASASAVHAKGEQDADGWLPPRTGYRCAYVARQVAVKLKYHLWVTTAERKAISAVLTTCPSQALPR